MKLFHRKDVPPAEVLATLPKGERVVSWADTADGAVVLATPSGLWWPSGDGPRLIGWQYVDKATWQDGRLTVVEAQVVDDVLLVDLTPVSTELTVVRDLPPTVRKRVEANVIRTEVRDVPGGSARFVARRIPGADGIHWWARLEPGTRDTAEARSAIRYGVTQWRAAWEATQADL